jgi:hypothetical protein
MLTRIDAVQLEFLIDISLLLFDVSWTVDRFGRHNGKIDDERIGVLVANNEPEVWMMELRSKQWGISAMQKQICRQGCCELAGIRWIAPRGDGAMYEGRRELAALDRGVGGNKARSEFGTE